MNEIIKCIYLSFSNNLPLKFFHFILLSAPKAASYVTCLECIK